MAFDGQNLNNGDYEEEEFEFIELDDSNGIHVNDIDLSQGYSDDDNDEDHNYDNNIYYQQDDDNSKDEKTSDLISEFLKMKGITDRNSIKYENEKGEIEESKFDELTLEEQLEILSYSAPKETDDEYQSELEGDEKDFFDHLKKNNISINDYLEYYKQSVIEELGANNSLSDLDNLSNDEIFIFDLKQRFPDFTEEEILEELETAKSKPEVFEKKSANLKEHYKKVEEQEKEAETQRQLESSRKESERVQKLILEASREVKEIGPMELEDDDIQSALDIIFTQDADGNTQLNNALNDPKSLIEIAWFLSKGKESIENLAGYYRNIIKEKDSVIKKAEKANKNQPSVVVDKGKKNQNYNKKKDLSIDDLDFFSRK